MNCWLDVPHAADHVGYPDALSSDRVARKKAIKAFLAWVERDGVIKGHRGRRPVFHPADLDRALCGSDRTKDIVTRTPLTLVKKTAVR